MSELDPSCEKITFISNPVADVTKGAGQGRGAAGGTAGTSKPLFRIKAFGDFGSTEVCVTLIVFDHLPAVFIEKRGINFDVGLYRWITQMIERYWRPLNARGRYRSGNHVTFLRGLLMLN